MPPLAHGFTIRPESGADVFTAAAGSPVVALTPRARRSGAGPLAELLRSAGKTQLAVHYAQAQWNARAVDLLVWVDASSRASILSGYTTAAAALTGARTPDGAESAAASLLRWLGQTDRRWLVVLDDVPDSTVLHGLWPRGPAGCVVMTTANSQVAAGLPDAVVLEVGAFSPREAMSFLVSRLSSDPDQRRGAYDLIEDLGCQPLALGQAAAAISTSRMTCMDFRDHYYRRLAAIASAAGQPPAAGVTWTLSVDRAGGLVPPGSAEACLALTALLDGHGIPAAVFETEAACTYVAGTAGPAADRARGVLVALEQVGLISIDRDADLPMVRMNSALQRVVQLAMSPGLVEHAGRAAAAALLEAWPSGADWPAGHAMRAGVTYLHRATGKLLWSGGCHPVLLRAGRSLEDARLTGPAADYWSELASVAAQALGPAHPDSVAIVEHLDRAA